MKVIYLGFIIMHIYLYKLTFCKDIEKGQRLVGNSPQKTENYDLDYRMDPKLNDSVTYPEDSEYISMVPFPTGVCRLNKLEPYEDCLEMGCEVGSRCHKEELQDFTCCPYIFNKYVVTCCSASLECLHSREACPPVEIPKNHHCMEVGCIIGQKCETASLSNQLCCHHKKDGIPLSCCLVTPTASPVDRCTVYNPNGRYYCAEPGCDIGSPCKSIGLNDKDCCSYTINEIEVNCCLKLKEVPEEAECPPARIPSNYNCMELGCIEGKSCTTKGLEQHRCCLQTINDISITCCLAKPVFSPKPPHDYFVFPCPAFEIPNKNYNCMQIGCYEGDRCLNKGLEQRKCCEHRFKGNNINCCLTLPNATPAPPITSRCPRYDDDEDYFCKDIGCTLGQSCIKVGLPDQDCCNYMIENMYVNCCLQTESSHFTENLIGCPKVENLSNNYHCMEIGCNVGEFCITDGAQGIKCCPFQAGHYSVNCCPKKQSEVLPEGIVDPVPIERGDCPPEEIPRFYHCYEAGCVPSMYCVTEGLQYRKCCSHRINGVLINCCIAKPTYEANSLPGCSPVAEIPENFDCMDIGCDEGRECTSAGVEGDICCPYLYNNFRISCCVRWRNVKTVAYPPPRSSKFQSQCVIKDIPPHFNCMEIGCTEGHSCTISGLQDKVCCKHFLNNIPITCCLSLPRPIGCKRMIISKIKYDCIEIGCFAGTECSDPKTINNLCCPYLYDGFHITCCLRLYDETRNEQKYLHRRNYTKRTE